METENSTDFGMVIYVGFTHLRFTIYLWPGNGKGEKRVLIKKQHLSGKNQQNTTGKVCRNRKKVGFIANKQGEIKASIMASKLHSWGYNIFI